MVVGRVPPSVAGYLRFLDQGRTYSLEYEDVLQEKLADAHNDAGDAGVRLEFEARSWLLTHYMLSSDDRRKRLSRYLAFVAAGTAPTTAFERAFDMKAADIGTVLWRYGLKGMEVLRVVPPSLPTAHVSFRSMPLAAGEFMLADAALKSCPSREAGESLLKKAIALAARFPDDKQGRLTLSRAQIDWGDPRDALPRLEALLKQDETNVEAEYLAGMANLRMAAVMEGDARRAQLQAAQRHLRRARTLDPLSAEAAFAAFKAEVAASDAPDNAALLGVVSAWQASREAGTLAKSAALAGAYAGRADEVRQALESLARNTRDMPTAAWARQWRSRLETGVTRGELVAEMRRVAASDVPFKEWTIDKQGVLQKVELAHGLRAAESAIKAAQEKDARVWQATPIDGGQKKGR
jgi:tetratricopeptide (TPR) repeat protein